MRQLAKIAFNTLKEEGVFILFSQGKIFLINYFLSPVGIVSLLLDGKSFSDSLRVLQLGKPFDRIDALLDPIVDISPPFVENTVRANHISRYLFSIGEYDTSGSPHSHLDLACGFGYSSKIIRTLYPDWRYVGLDIDRGAVRYARRYYGENADYILSDASSLPVGDDSFDTISCFETLEHVQHDESLLRELKRVVKTDGTVAISVPNYQTEQDLTGKEKLKDYPHVNLYDPDEFSDIISSVFSNANVDMYIQRSVVKHPQRLENPEAQYPYGFYRIENSDGQQGVIIAIIHMDS